MKNLDEEMCEILFSCIEKKKMTVVLWLGSLCRTVDCRITNIFAPLYF